MKDSKELLGIFDSGVGGFSVLKEIRKITDADIVYFGDCARAPYGNRSEEEIVSFIKEILFDLKSQGVTHFVSACNSMSVVTTEKLLKDAGIEQDNYIDMVGAVRMIPFEKGARILAVGTQATIRSSVYQSLLKQQGLSVDVFAPNSLAGEIENGDKNAIRKSVQKLVSYAVDNSATHILYACTHYPLVDSVFKEEARASGWRGEYIDPARYVASKVKTWNVPGNRTVCCATSQETKTFKKYKDKLC